MSLLCISQSLFRQLAYLTLMALRYGLKEKTLILVIFLEITVCFFFQLNSIRLCIEMWNISMLVSQYNERLFVFLLS